MPNPLSIGDAGDLVDLRIQKIFVKSQDPKSLVFFDKYFNVQTGITDLDTRDSSLSGLGYAGRVLENAVITAESSVQGYDKLYTFDKTWVY
jgi:hypothetical protein